MKRNPDVVGIDWELQGSGEYPRKYPNLHLQLKCTSAIRSNGNLLRYPLEVKNYNKLQGPSYDAARILVVVYVPDSVNSWLKQSEEELAVRHCAYWLSLRNAPATSNSTTVTVPIPRENKFTVEALRTMMDQIGNGGFP